MTNQADKADRGVNRNGHEGEAVAVVDLDWSQAFGPLETSCMSKEFNALMRHAAPGPKLDCTSPWRQKTASGSFVALRLYDLRSH